MPDIELPKREAEDIEVREIETTDVVADLEDEDIGVEEEVEPLPPPPQKKEKLKKEDIFKPKAPPKKQIAREPVIEEQEPIVPTITPVKKKRQLSDKQKEALAKGRAKRMANKKKAPAPEPEPVYEPPASEVAYKQKKMNEDYNRQHPINNGLSQEQIQEMIFQGVERYDTMRKKRKEQKRKAQAAQNHDKKVFNDINSQLRVNDPWSSAFNF
jgi:hypothetical protein